MKRRGSSRFVSHWLLILLLVLNTCLHPSASWPISLLFLLLNFWTTFSLYFTLLTYFPICVVYVLVSKQLPLCLMSHGSYTGYFFILQLIKQFANSEGTMDKVSLNFMASGYFFCISGSKMHTCDMGLYQRLRFHCFLILPKETCTFKCW